MTVSYGSIAHGNKDPLLARARELHDIITHIISPEKAAMFTAFPFRESHNHMSIRIFKMLVVVEKLPTWFFGGQYAKMGRTRVLTQQLLNEPFNEVKKRMVRFRAVDGFFA
jgi:hypothetical protein